MSVQNIGTNRWRMKAKGGIDPETGAIKYFDTTMKGTHEEAKRLEAEHTLFDRDMFSALPVRDYAEVKWLPAMKEEVAGNTYDYYAGAVRRYIVPLVGDVRLRDMSTAKVKAWLLKLPETGKTQARKTMSAMLSYAAEDELIQVNPMTMLRQRSKRTKGSKRRRKPHATFGLEECLRFQRAIEGTCIEAVCLVMLNAGARREEACALDWEDFDWERARAPVEKAYVVRSAKGVCEMKDPKNDESWRDLKFSGYAYDRLYELSIGQTGPICRDRDGGRMRPDDANDLFKAVVELYGFTRMTIGNLRHTFATRHLLDGTSVAELRDLMGHSSTSTIINEYLIPMQDALAAAQEKFAARMDPRQAEPGR